MTTVRRSQPKTLPVEVLDGTARKLRRTLQGKENFTGLLVGGQGVKPFLDKTDGEKLVEPSGLDAGVVETPAIAVEAVTKSRTSVVAGPVDVKSTSPVLLSSESVTVGDGERVELLLVYALGGSGGDATNIGLLTALSYATLSRDATVLTTSIVGSVIKGIAQASSAAVAFSDEPAAGTYTYSAHALLDTTSNVNALAASNVYLSVTVVTR